MRTGHITLATRSPDQTRDVGAVVGGLLGSGEVVSLTGDLGAGKTCLVQGAARALGVTQPVASPTFVLVREYRGTVPVVHVDVYRLDRIQEVLDLGFQDLLDERAVVFVEWGNAIDALLPDSYLEIALHITSEDDRRIDITGRGPVWAERWGALEERLGQWRAA